MTQEKKYRLPDEVYHKGRKVSVILDEAKELGFQADLKGANFWRCNLSGLDLADALLTGAQFKHSILRSVDFSMSNLNECNLMHCDLRDANFEYASVRNAKLYSANFEGANLSMADFSESNMQFADLSSTDLDSTVFNRANLRYAKFNKDTKFLGTQLVDTIGELKFMSFAKHQIFVNELKFSKRWSGEWFYHKLWNLFADCGRTVTRWILWSIMFAVTFAGLFYYTEYFWPGSFKMNSLTITDCWPYFYYSIVTFTTLGFGDITPLTNWASVLVVIEVIFGYVMLGGLISILATKLARRS